jgi:hypothetical protein
LTRDTTAKGDLSELEVALALVRAGYPILRPLSSGLRYDLAVDNRDGTISRVQCNTGILRKGFIEFNVSSADGRRPKGVAYVGQVEAFGIYCPQNRKVYLVPIDRIVARVSRARLRTDATKNGQVRGVTLAAAFEIATQQSPTDGP